MRDTLTLSIEGMHCEACVRRVTGALQGVPGVQLGSVEVGSAQLAYEAEEATPGEIAAAVNRIGFQAHVAK
jgi:copper chaperone/Cu+-exporting ATPase